MADFRSVKWDPGLVILQLQCSTIELKKIIGKYYYVSYYFQNWLAVMDPSVTPELDITDGLLC